MPPQQSPDGNPSVVIDRGAPPRAQGPCIKLEIVPIAGRPGSVPGPPGAMPPGGGPTAPPGPPGPGGSPIPGGPSPGGPANLEGTQQYALRCYRAGGGPPDSAMAANPDDLMRLVAQALGLPNPDQQASDNTPEDMTTESATAPAA